MTGVYDSCITIAKPNMGSTHKLKFDMRHVETPESRNIQFNTDTLWFEEGSSNDLTAEYLAENGSKTKTEIVKDWVSSNTFSKGYGYKMINKSLKAGNIVEADGLLLVPPEDDGDETK